MYCRRGLWVDLDVILNQPEEWHGRVLAGKVAGTRPPQIHAWRQVPHATAHFVTRSLLGLYDDAECLEIYLNR